MHIGYKNIIIFSFNCFEKTNSYLVQKYLRGKGSILLLVVVVMHEFVNEMKTNKQKKKL